MERRRRRGLAIAPWSCCCYVTYLVVVLGIVATGVVVPLAYQRSAHPPPPSTSTPAPLSLLYLHQTQSLDAGDDNMINAGDVITITTLIQNLGATNLFNITLTGVSCDAIPVLLVGSAAICTSRYNVTQLDIDAGIYAVQTCGTDESDLVHVCVDSSTNLSPLLSIVQQIDYELGSNDVLSVGDVANVTVTVCNVGTETLLNVTTDMHAVDSLEPGECFDYSYLVILERLDFETGVRLFHETATATGDAIGQVTQTAETFANLTRPIFPDLEVTQNQTVYLGMDDMLNAGDVISIHTVLVNQGTEDLYNITLDDSVPVGTICAPANVDNQIAILLEGESVTCMGMYTILQDDIDAAQFVLSTLAEGVGAVTSIVISNTTDSVGNLTQTTFGALSVNQMADILKGPDDFLGEGDEVLVMVVLVNVGTETLLDVSADNFNGTLVAELLPMESVNFTYSISLTQAMLDAETLVLNETGVGIGTTSAQPVYGSNTLEINVTQTLEGRISLTTSFAQTASCAKVGVVMLIDVVVENYGTGPMYNVAVQNTLVGTNLVCAPMGVDNTIAELLPGQQETCSGGYMLTNGDVTFGIDSLLISNTTGTVDGPDPLPEIDLQFTYRAVYLLYFPMELVSTTGYSNASYVAEGDLVETVFVPGSPCINDLLARNHNNMNGRSFFWQNIAVHPRHLYARLIVGDIDSGSAQIFTTPPNLFTAWEVTITNSGVWNPSTGVMTRTGVDVTFSFVIRNLRDISQIEVHYTGVNSGSDWLFARLLERPNTTRIFP